MKEFGRTEYEKVAYLYCQENPVLENLFSQAFNVERMLDGFQLLCGFKINADDTLIILDEIQEIPKAITSLKLSLIITICKNSLTISFAFSLVLASC